MHLCLGSEDYLEFNIATDVKVEHSGGISEENQVEELPETSRSSTPLATVLPSEVPCEVSEDALLFKWPCCSYGYFVNSQITGIFVYFVHGWVLRTQNKGD